MEKQTEKPDTKKCSRCRMLLPTNEFSSNASRKDGLSPYCKFCKAMYRQERAWQDREYQKRAYQDNIEERRLEARRRMRLKRAVTKIKAGNMQQFVAQWEVLCAGNAYRCFCCGRERALQVDHIIPVAQGGSDNILNLQPLCATCNRRKGNQIIDYRPNPNRGEAQ